MAKKKHSSHRSASSNSHNHHEYQSIILLLAGGLVVVLCLIFIGGSKFMPNSMQYVPSDQVMHPTEMHDSMMQNQKTDSGPTQAAMEGTTVKISNYAFYPQTTYVKVGSAVTFENDDTVAHTATVYAGSLDTGNIPVGANKTVIFRTAGTYAYKCLYHPKMTGTVIVQ